MINAEILNKAGINYEAGMKRFMNDPELYEAVLTAFISEDILERAEEAYAAGDHDRLARVIHEAKGSSGNAGLDSLYEEASALMVLLRSKSVAEQKLADGYRRFAAAYSTVRDGVRAAMGQ